MQQGETHKDKMLLKLASSTVSVKDTIIDSGKTLVSSSAIIAYLKTHMIHLDNLRLEFKA